VSVFVSESDPCLHLGDVGGTMMVVRIDERSSERVRKPPTDRRFP
jgi:hypothetical protein